MLDVKVDEYEAALKLIEILLEKRKDKSSHIYKYNETPKFAHFTSGLIKDTI